MSTAKYVTDISVIDPDSGDEVELSVYRHEGGGMFAIDSSYIAQVLELVQALEFGDGALSIPDPYSFVADHEEVELTY